MLAKLCVQRIDQIINMRSRFSTSIVSQILILVSFASSSLRAVALPVDTPSSDYSSLVYKNCNAYEASSPDPFYIEHLDSFFREVIAKSSELKFYRTAVGQFTGLFQCRGDLSSSECNGCITKLPGISSNNLLCAAARIQLSGCYVCYWTDGFDDDDHERKKKKKKKKKKNNELVSKKCSDEKGPDGDHFFKKARDDAFSDAQKGLKDGCYVGSVDDKVRVIAQCEGDLSECNCAECVYYAVQYAGDKCGNSIKGEIYLNKCFLRYSYKTPDHPKPPHDDDDGPVPPAGHGPGPGVKTLAIAVGGAAVVCAVFACCLLVKNSGRKHDDC